MRRVWVRYDNTISSSCSITKEKEGKLQISFLSARTRYIKKSMWAFIFGAGLGAAGWFLLCKVLNWNGNSARTSARKVKNKKAAAPLSAIHEEEIEAATAASSVISGEEIISESKAQEKLKLGKKVRALDSEDVFYKKPGTFWDGKGEKPDSAYDPQYDYDFTNHISSNERCTRGDYPYHYPRGAHVPQEEENPLPPQEKQYPLPRSRPISTWTNEEGYEATAAAFSVISGVKIISEREVKKQIELGKQVTPLDIKDVFYKKLSTSLDSVGQERLFYIPDSAYDPQYDCDFTNHQGDDKDCSRGDYPYKRPAGWNRKAVKVIGKYEDDVWLGQGGWRSKSSPGEWPVSYHGTEIQNVPSIVTDGYDTEKCVNNAYGVGIYSTPDVKIAEGYATKFNYKGKDYLCILQNRVNLRKTDVVNNGTYFVTPDDKNIRPYGVCLKKI